jgi:hypothetical protein
LVIFQADLGGCPGTVLDDQGERAVSRNRSPVPHLLTHGSHGFHRQETTRIAVPLSLAEQWQAVQLGSSARRKAMTRHAANAMLEMQFPLPPLFFRAHAAHFFWSAYTGALSTRKRLGADARLAHSGPAPPVGAASRGRIYVCSRHRSQNYEMLGKGEESIYGPSTYSGFSSALPIATP